MISDETHPALQAAMRELHQRLSLFVGLEPFTHHILDQMMDTVKRHRESCKLKGIDFPVLVPLVVVRFGVVDWVREDLDAKSVATTIQNFVRRYSNFRHPQLGMVSITKEEMLKAFRFAFPRLRIGDAEDIGERLIRPEGETLQ